MNNWKETTLGELAKNVSRRFDFSDKEKVVFVNTGDVLDGKFLHSNYLNSEGLPGQAKKAIHKGDILFSEIRPINKRFALVDFDASDYVVSTKFMVICGNEKVNPKFLYIYLTSLQTLQEFQIIAESRSGTFPQITFDSIAKFPILLPPLPEQREIAAVLGSLDDKIELLRKENETLEKIAQTIFKEWFVDFTINGEKLKLENGIPEGWRVGKFNEVVKICGGTTPDTKNLEYWNGNINWTSPKDLSDNKEMFLTKTKNKITEKGLAKIGSGLLPLKTLLLSSRAPIGYLAITNIAVAINQGYIAFLPDGFFSNEYMFIWLKLHMDKVVSSANGSTFLEISKTSFKNIEVIIPEKSFLDNFQNVIEPIFAKILNNINQIQTISNSRDTLLPKLMSGEVPIK